MRGIYEKVEDIITLAEVQDGFYEVEVSVLVRRNEGACSDFIRMTLDHADADKPVRQVTVKQSVDKGPSGHEEPWF